MPPLKSISGFLKKSFSSNLARFEIRFFSHYYTYLDWFPRVAKTKQTGPKNIKVESYCHSVLETRNSKSRCQQGQILSEDSKGGNLFDAT